MEAYLVGVTIFLHFVAAIESTSFTINNNCPYTIWPAAQDSANAPSLGTTGFALNQGASSTITAPSNWVGRLWARTLCGTNSSGGFACATGDCGTGKIPCNGNGGAPPATLAEFTLNGYGGKDFYDVSNVDGFNAPVTIAPSGGCPASSCPNNINTACPSELQVKDSNGNVIGCKSACLAFGSDNFCCTGANNTPKTCPQTNYSEFFSSECPQAYSYAYDDHKGTFTCPTGGDYVITFCPPSTQPQYIGMICIP